MKTKLEHTNLTVSDSKATAAWMCDMFGWHIRWEGKAINGGYTVHVGEENSYLALFTPLQATSSNESSYDTVGGLNHVGVVGRVHDWHLLFHNRAGYWWW